jgi:2'-5' RNA ligase
LDVSDSVSAQEIERFRNIRWLHDHWSRPASRRAYYWYLTFEDSPDLHSLSKRCQDAIDFPYYDLMPLQNLHLTLDRVAFAADINPDLLRDIEAAATYACRETAEFDIALGPLGGTAGAIGFNIAAAEQIANLRNRLRAATLSVYPDAPVRRSELHPHVTIAYVNSDNVPAADVIAAVEKLNAAEPFDATVTVKHAALVLLEQQPRAYQWQAVSQIPLVGRLR